MIANRIRDWLRTRRTIVYKVSGDSDGDPLGASVIGCGQADNWLGDKLIIGWGQADNWLGDELITGCGQ